MVSVGYWWGGDIRRGFAWMWAVEVQLQCFLWHCTVSSRSPDYSHANLVFSSSCWPARRPQQCYVYYHGRTQWFNTNNSNVWTDWRCRYHVGTNVVLFPCGGTSIIISLSPTLSILNWPLCGSLRDVTLNSALFISLHVSLDRSPANAKTRVFLVVLWFIHMLVSHSECTP